jgi:hypothetical protein
MKCLLPDCQAGNCPSCINARCAWCHGDTRFTHSHTLKGKVFCGPSDSSPCAWLYRQHYAEAAYGAPTKDQSQSVIMPTVVMA